jgi:hypothetical protein
MASLRKAKHSPEVAEVPTSTTSTSYRAEQKMYRELAAPKRVPELLYDDHDREWMKKGTPVNRKARREKYADPALTKPNTDYQRNKRVNGKLINFPHVVNDYRYQRELPEGTNHERMLKRRATDDE